VIDPNSNFEGFAIVLPMKKGTDRAMAFAELFAVSQELEGCSGISATWNGEDVVARLLFTNLEDARRAEARLSGKPHIEGGPEAPQVYLN
jgi:hypothetical protein